jgi:IS5 family transposase
MSTPDFFRARLDGMVDPRHPLVVLTGRLAWAQIEQVLAPHFERKARTPGTAVAQDMLGEHEVEFGGGVGRGGRPRLPIRLMASLLYLKNSFNLSDEELVTRWSENVVWVRRTNRHGVGGASPLQ